MHPLVLCVFQARLDPAAVALEAAKRVEVTDRPGNHSLRRKQHISARLGERSLGPQAYRYAGDDLEQDDALEPLVWRHDAAHHTELSEREGLGPSGKRPVPVARKQVVAKAARPRQCWRSADFSMCCCGERQDSPEALDELVGNLV